MVRLAESLADAMPSEVSSGAAQARRSGPGAHRRPRQLCLDEPAAGLDVTESEELGRRLRQIVDGGIVVLLVDHDMGLVLGISDHVVVLEFGKVIATGSPRPSGATRRSWRRISGGRRADVEEATA